jgi:hypothetical protein
VIHNQGENDMRIPFLSKKSKPAGTPLLTIKPRETMGSTEHVYGERNGMLVLPSGRAVSTHEIRCLQIMGMDLGHINRKNKEAGRGPFKIGRKWRRDYQNWKANRRKKAL